MPIEIADRYKLIFEEHHFASDFRVKILQAWCLFYAAFAAGLGWVQANANAKPISWVLTALALIITMFMWVADFRHRNALASSKRVGAAIEDAADIPENQRFFASIKPGWLTHSLAVDVFTGLMIFALFRSSVFLSHSGGDLSSLPPNIFWWALAGGVAGYGFHLTLEPFYDNAPPKLAPTQHRKRSPVWQKENGT